MATYLVAAALTPPLVLPAGLLVPGTNDPPVSLELNAGDTTRLLTVVNTNALNADLVGRRGGGGYAVTEGLTLSAAGLVATVAAGQAMLDGPVTRAASGTVALADNAYNWLWLLQGGTLTKTSSGSTTPPAAPSAACVFLGRIQVTAGTPGTEDYSGRWELRGGYLWRRTGDAGVPGDTPSAAAAFLTRTAGGLFFWDGVGWFRMMSATPAAAIADTTGASLATVESSLNAVKALLRSVGLLAP